MRWLFVKESLAWPRSSGHDVHCHGLMRGLATLGERVFLKTFVPPQAQAIDGLPADVLVPVSESSWHPKITFRLSRAQERFRNYWGIEEDRIRAVRQAADATRADVVVVVGLNVLPWLGAIAGPVRAWYAADEWFWHHTSMIRPLRPKTWRELKPAIIKGWYERSFASMIDRAWVVSEADRRAMRWVAGIDTIDVIPNGVDSKWYSPTEGAVIPRSCVFWGRLDFGPNIQAIEWFCRSVWPLVRRRVPDATLSIFGFQPAPVIERIAGNYGVELFPNLPDIRAEVQRRAVAVLPFVSGGGIKNKLLEACALGMTVVCTPRSRSGLRGRDLPLIVASKPREWVERLVELWENDGSRRATAARARAWVVENHSWESAARIARDGAALHRMKIGAP